MSYNGYLSRTLENQYNGTYTKKPNAKLLNDLRPIALIPLPGGFRNGRDTCQTIFNLVDYTYAEFNKNAEYCIAAFSDLAKAFDTMDRTLLLKKLKFYGITGQFHEWLTNNLSNRKHIVNINASFSNKFDIDFGVPQGSILGPLLFNLIINDLCDYNFKSEICIYADDIVFITMTSHWQLP